MPSLSDMRSELAKVADAKCYTDVLQGKQMIESSTNEPLSPGRPSKFTPANIRQIINLVERGKSREEIADIIGVTPGTLAVTCSRLNISLRRPRFDLGTGLLRQRPRSRAPNGVNLAQLDGIKKSGVPEKMEEQLQRASNHRPIKDVAAVAPHTAIFDRTSIQTSLKLGVRMQYKDNDQTIELPLNLEMVGRLFLEAEFRNIRIGELLARLILGIAEKDLFQLVLESQLAEPIIVTDDTGGAIAEGKQLHPMSR
jgi:hypothetical protein